MPVRVLMLGWEFPPFITGGLGTACYGLVKAMDRAGMKVDFVLPKSVSDGQVEGTSGVMLRSPSSDLGEELPDFEAPPPRPAPSPGEPPAPAAPRTEEAVHRAVEIVRELRSQFRNVNFVDLPLEVQSVYREQANAWTRVIELTAQKVGDRPVERMGIVHVDALDQARRFEEQLRAGVACPDDILIAGLSAGLSTYGGAGIVGGVLVRGKD